MELKLYAGEGIPEYWIVNLRARTVEVHSDPTPEGYRVVRKLHDQEVLEPSAFPDLGLTVADILG